MSMRSGRGVCGFCPHALMERVKTSGSGKKFILGYVARSTAETGGQVCWMFVEIRPVHPSRRIFSTEFRRAATKLPAK